MIKERRKPFSSFIELLLEHVTVNETGAFGVPADKENRGQYVAYTLLFYKQPVYRQRKKKKVANICIFVPRKIFKDAQKINV